MGNRITQSRNILNEELIILKAHGTVLQNPSLLRQQNKLERSRNFTCSLIIYSFRKYFWSIMFQVDSNIFLIMI